MIHTNPVVKQWQVVNVHTGHELLVDAVGPKDALFSLVGVCRLTKVEQWLWSGDWKVNTVAVSALGLRGSK